MLYEITVPQFIKMLNNLSLILDKAESFAQSKKVDFEVLLNSRLAVDQFSFVRQIQITCDTAKLCTARLANREAPSHTDTEKTLPELRTRIASVIAYLETFSAKDFESAATVKVTQARWEGQYLNGEEYALQHAIPNFYFHLTTAYSILRHSGVEIGKKDYLGKMPFKK